MFILAYHIIVTARPELKSSPTLGGNTNFKNVTRLETLFSAFLRLCCSCFHFDIRLNINYASLLTAPQKREILYILYIHIESTKSILGMVCFNQSLSIFDKSKYPRCQKCPHGYNKLIPSKWFSSSVFPSDLSYILASIFQIALKWKSLTADEERLMSEKQASGRATQDKSDSTDENKKKDRLYLR